MTAGAERANNRRKYWAPGRAIEVRKRKEARGDEPVPPDSGDEKIVVYKPTPIQERPRGWNKMPDGQRAIVILGMGFERAFDYLSWDPDTCDAHRLSAQREVVSQMMRLVVRRYVEDRKDNRADAALIAKMTTQLLKGSNGSAHETLDGEAQRAPAPSQARSQLPISGGDGATTSSAAQPQDAE